MLASSDADICRSSCFCFLGNVGIKRGGRVWGEKMRQHRSVGEEKQAWYFDQNSLTLDMLTFGDLESPTCGLPHIVVTHSQLVQELAKSENIRRFSFGGATNSGPIRGGPKRSGNIVKSQLTCNPCYKSPLVHYQITSRYQSNTVILKKISNTPQKGKGVSFS